MDAYLGAYLGAPCTLKRCTDLILSTLGENLGNLLGDKFNLIELPPRSLNFWQHVVTNYVAGHMHRSNSPSPLLAADSGGATEEQEEGQAAAVAERPQ